MPNLREVRLRIQGVKNISQVTRALQAVSASKVRKAMTAMMNTRAYATHAWRVLTAAVAVAWPQTFSTASGFAPRVTPGPSWPA